MTISSKANEAAADSNVVRQAMVGFVLQTGLNGLLENMRMAGFDIAYKNNEDRPGLVIEMTKAGGLSFRLLLSAQDNRGLNQPLIEYSRDDREGVKTIPSVLDIHATISSWVMDNLPRITNAAPAFEIVKGANISPSKP